MRHRRGVTLIELLIVIAIITVLATLIVAVAPRFGERQRASRGAGQLQSWIQLAKQRALRDQRPVGIRLPHQDSTSTSTPFYVREVQYIEVPNENLGGTITVPFPNYPTPAQAYQNVLFTTTLVLDPTQATSPLLPFDVITLLNEALGAYAPRRITNIVAVAPSTPGFNNYCITLDQPWPQASSFTTATYQVSRRARPVVGEPVLQLPKDIAIDIDRDFTNTNPTWCRMYPPTANNGGNGPFDILFSPAGQVIGAEGNLGSRICLWVRDVSLNTTGANVGNDPNRTDPTALPPGENSLITIYCRTGHVTAHPIEPAGLIPNSTSNPNSWNPFKFTQDGLSSGQ